MLRGVRIDLETARAAFADLLLSYGKDLQSTEMSDETIRHVGTFVKSIRGALDKTANEVWRLNVPNGKRGPYFPFADSQAKFEIAIEQQIPGLLVGRPDIANEFARFQPYQPGCEPMAHLPMLYRVNAHHDFTLQERRESVYMAMMVGGMHITSIGPHGFQIGGRPPGSVVIDASLVGDPQGVAALHATVLDWHFVDPPVSVLATLLSLNELAVGACTQISEVAGF